MPAFQKFHPFVEAQAHKKHNLGADELKIFLCAAANPPLATNAVLTDLTEIDYTYCSSRVTSRISSAQVSGVYRLILNGLLLTATGGSFGPFRYYGLYNNTATNKDLIGFYDYGVDLTFSAGESFFIGFDGALGVLSNT